MVNLQRGQCATSAVQVSDQANAQVHTTRITRSMGAQSLYPALDNVLKNNELSVTNYFCA